MECVRQIHIVHQTVRCMNISVTINVRVVPSRLLYLIPSTVIIYYWCPRMWQGIIRVQLMQHTLSVKREIQTQTDQIYTRLIDLQVWNFGLNSTVQWYHTLSTYLLRMAKSVAYNQLHTWTTRTQLEQSQEICKLRFTVRLLDILRHILYWNICSEKRNFQF